jgi:hypothetical protein
LANAKSLALVQEKEITQIQAQKLEQALTQIQIEIQTLTEAQSKDPTSQQEQALKQAQALENALTLKSVDCILDWSNWSNCDTFTGEQTRTAPAQLPSVAQAQALAQSKGINCPTKETKACPVNCQGEWSEWSCNAICPGNTIKYKVKSTVGFGQNQKITYIDEQEMNKFVHDVSIPYNNPYFEEKLEETDILNNNVFSTVSTLTPKFSKFYWGNRIENEKITSYDTTKAQLFRTYKVNIPPLNNGSPCPYTHGEIQTGTDCSTNCYDCKYSLTETLPCDAACPSWDNQNNIIKSGNAHYINNFVSTVNKDGNQATRSGTYKIIKQESNGGKACLAKDGDIIKENCSKTCDFDCKGEWLDVTPCNATCPGNADDNNNGISSIKSFLAPGTTEPNINPATLNKKYKINNNKLPGGKPCEAADKESKSFPCTKICKLNCKYNWKTTGCECDDYESSRKEGNYWVRDGTNTKTTTIINRSYNGGTCDIIDSEEYDIDNNNNWTGSNTFESYTNCKCYGYHEGI